MLVGETGYRPRFASSCMMVTSIEVVVVDRIVPTKRKRGLMVLQLAVVVQSFLGEC